MSVTTLRKRINQYVTFETQFLNFPKELNVRNCICFGYLQGMRVNKLKGMSVFTFDSVSYLRTSQNAKTKDLYIHCLGYIEHTKTITSIILKEQPFN